MPIVTMFDQTAGRGHRRLPADLGSLYDGDLTFPDRSVGRPLVIGNFVQSLDAIVSLQIPGKSGGAAISGRNEEDTFIMGLLRASADAVLIGEETFRAGAGHLWTASFIYPKLERQFLDLRQHLRKRTDHPLNVIVSGLGTVDLSQPLFRRGDIQGLVLTTKVGERTLKQRYGEDLPARVHVLTGESFIEP